HNRLHFYYSPYADFVEFARTNLRYTRRADNAHNSFRMATRLSSVLLPSLSPAKDPAAYPVFKGEVTRYLWRLYSQRLTPAGRWFLLTSLILIGYGGSSLQIQAYVLAGYVTAVWWIALIAVVLYRPLVKLSATMSSRISVDEVLPVDVEIEQ